jgi:hypothetical protein
MTVRIRTGLIRLVARSGLGLVWFCGEYCRVEQRERICGDISVAGRREWSSARIFHKYQIGDIIEILELEQYID